MKKSLTLLLTTCVVFLFCCTNATDEEKKEVVLKEPASVEELGELLFFDPLFSKDSSISCASCHKPAFAFADNIPFSFGVDSTPGTRNTPSAMNLADRGFFFHDGRAESLEEQAKGPVENPMEMNMPFSLAIDRLKKHKQYASFFKKHFGQLPNLENVTKAIADYERSLQTADTPFDDYMSKYDTTLFSEAAKRGRKIFNVKGKCFDCHFGPDFTGDQFRNIGLFNGKELNDSGRYVVTKKASDIGKFKTPGLRNAKVTAPYMHNGMFKTLKEVIDYYDQPDKFVSNSINRDTLLSKPLNLTAQEKADLEAFLISLTDRQFK
ncbi:MAG: cytochrome-c peroxidase [Bacteroidetes bacterium]|nr:cytochrome-c peroxidase [Bacteroidota bacterium]